MIEAIIVPDYGFFIPDKKILEQIKSLGYDDGRYIFQDINIKLRTDKRLIKWIKDKTNGKTSYSGRNNILDCGGGFIHIVKVDNSRPWKIETSDEGSEYIQYLDYKIIDKELNYGDFITKRYD